MTDKTLYVFAAALTLGCSPPWPRRDSSTMVSDAGDATTLDLAHPTDGDIPEEPLPAAEPGSTEGLLREVCAGRARTGEPATLAYYTGPALGALRSAQEGDAEALRLTLTQPFRLRRIRVFLRGSADARARIRLTEDIGRSIPALSRDLMEAVEVQVPMQGWYEVSVDPPVDLHPAYHAWVVVEHAAEPVGLMVAAKSDMDGQPARSRARIAFIVNDPVMNPQRDPWLGLGTTREFMVEALGETLCPRQGMPYFTDLSSRVSPMLAAGRPQWVDLDSDGWDDLVAFRGGRGEASRIGLYRNRHDGSFEDTTEASGLGAVPISTATWADLDADGTLDLYAGDFVEGAGPFDPSRGSRVYLQGSSGSFTAVSAPIESPGPTDAHALADCDGDGRLDLFVGQWLRTYPTFPGVSALFHGMPGGRFEDITLSAGLPLARGEPRRGIAPAFSAMWADYDNDGDPDLFVANYLGMPNNAYVNDGACHFTDMRSATRFAGTPPVHGTSFGIDFGDYDNDGDLDVFEANIAHARGDVVMIDRSRLLRNSGAPEYRFENVAATAGIIHNEGDHEGMFGDYDNDGDLDLVVSVGPAYGYQWWRLYRQEPDHRFSDVTYLSGLPNVWSGGVMFNDYDRDGDLDLAVGSATLMLLRNDLRTANHWIELRLHDRTSPNPDAIGARVTVTNDTPRMREVTAGRGFHSGQGPLTQHFGLGASAQALTVEVRWPPRGGAMPELTRYARVVPDHMYLIERGAPPRESP